MYCELVHPSKLVYKFLLKDNNTINTYDNKCSGYHLDNIIKNKTLNIGETIFSFDNLQSKAIHNYAPCVWLNVAIETDCSKIPGF